jgi:hypothetical protein
MTAHLSRRSLLRATPALAMPLALGIPAAASASPTDPLPALVDAYFAAQGAFEAGSYEPDGGNLTNTTCLAANAEMDRLRPLIEGTTATTADGIIAQLAYIEEDFSNGPGTTVSGVPVDLLHRLAVAVERLS